MIQLAAGFVMGVGLAYSRGALDGHAQSAVVSAVERFRNWLGEHIWSEDDMGGFIGGFTTPERERDSLANVCALFDLIDADWRKYTWAGRRGADVIGSGD